MIGNLLLRLARAVDAWPRAIAAGCISLAVLGAVAFSRMPLKTDLLDVLPADNPRIRSFTAFLGDFGMMDGLVFVVESRDPAPDLLVGTVETLGERLAASPLVASVDYNVLRSGSRLVAEHFPVYLDGQGIAALSRRLSPDGIRRQIARNREALLSPLSSPLESELIGRDPLNLREIVGASLLRRAPAGGLDLSTGYYLDRSRRMALVMARPRGNARDMAFVGKLYREAGRISAAAVEEAGGTGLVTVGLAGGYARASEAASAIWLDMTASFAVSMVVVLLLIYAALRPHPVVLLLFLATLFTALSWTFLLAYLVFGALNIVTSIVAGMLIGIFVDYMLLVYIRFEGHLRAEGPGPAAMEKTLGGMGKAIVSGAVTTAVAFFSVVVTRFRGLYELGVVAGLGVVLCLLATLLLMTSLLSWVARTRPLLLSAGRPAGYGATWAARAAGEGGRKVVAVFALLFVVSAFGAARIRFESGVDSLGLKKSAVQAVERKIEERFGRRGEPLFLVARAPDGKALEADFDALEAAGERWRKTGLVERFTSPALLVPPPGVQEARLAGVAAEGLADRYPGGTLAAILRREMSRQGMVADASVDAYAGGVAAALARRDVVTLDELSRSGDPRAPYFHNRDRRAVAAHLSPPGGRWSPEALSELRDDVSRLGPDFTLTGPSLIFDEIRATVVTGSLLAILISFAANFLVIRVHFGTWRRVPLVMLPVVAGTVLTLGAMGILGIRFNFFNISAVAIMFGFGVDYGIYLVQADAEEAAGDGTGAVRRVGGGICLCALTTMASCGSLVLTQYRGLASIGSVLSIGALCCLASALFLLPAVLGLARRTA